MKKSDEGDTFAGLGIDCGGQGEAGILTRFGPPRKFATPEEAVASEVSEMSDLDPAAADNPPVLVDASTESSRKALESRAYVIPNDQGFPVAKVVVLKDFDGSWFADLVANCVAAPSADEAGTSARSS